MHDDTGNEKHDNIGGVVFRAEQLTAQRQVEKQPLSDHSDKECVEIDL